MTRRVSVNSFIDEYARRGDETALVHRRGLRAVRWSYARLAGAANQFARELEARGVRQGERVLVRAANSPEWVAAFFGCALRGAVVVPLDVESAPEFVARVQAQVGAKLLLTDAELREPSEERRSISDLNIPILLSEELSETLARHAATPYRDVEVVEDDLLEIIYTSGTTAEPRGVTLTHRNFLANLAPLEEEIKKYLCWERFVHPIRFLNLVPLSHVFGQFMGIFVPQLLGGEVHFQESLNPSELIESVKRERISVVVAVPRMLESLREHVERREEAEGRGASFREAVEEAKRWNPFRRWWEFRRIHRRFGLKFWAFVTGGATLEEETEKFWGRLGFAVLQGYGMTETASLITVNHPFKKKHGSVGQALPGHEIKLGDDGEILVRGRNISPGYWGNGRKALTDEEGWLRTGDLGELDGAGNIIFKGRKKDVIVTAAGLNIYPDDLEAALNRQPEIRTSAVVSIEGPNGPEPFAVLIMKDEKADPARIVERANATLARHQQMRRWTVWPDPDFPRTPTQKIRKRDIAEAIKRGMRAEGGGMNQTEFQSQLSPSLNAFIPHPSSLIPSAKLSTDLQLDSLGRVELLSALEDRYQIEIDEAVFTAATTVGDIERILHEGAATVAEPSARYPYPRWALKFPATWARVVLYHSIALPITSLLCWVGVRGRRHLKDLKGPALFVSNHITYFDHALILSALPYRIRRRFAIAQEGERLRWWRRPPAGTPMLRRLRWQAQYFLVVLFFNTFSLPQKSGFRRSFAHAGEIVDRGFNVLVFPEGTRTPDGRLCTFMGGIGILATKLNIPVVPVRIDGLSELKFSGRRGFAGPGRVTVRFGEPVSFSEQDDPAQVTRELERRVAAL